MSFGNFDGVVGKYRKHLEKITELYTKKYPYSTSTNTWGIFTNFNFQKYTEGQWQAQVFIHYVDANGPNAEWKFDKRKGLAHHKSGGSDGYFLVRKNAFSLNACKNIIEQFEKNADMLNDAQLINNIVDKSIRNTKKIEVGVDGGIGASLTGIGLAANNHEWKFNITHSNQSEFLKYDTNGHFSEHTDTIMTQKSDQTRKLTIIAILNND